jgi:hypothetical protein
MINSTFIIFYFSAKMKILKIKSIKKLCVQNKLKNYL